MSMADCEGRSSASTLLGAVACVALLAGCAGRGPMAPDPVQKRWESRASLPSCGSLRLQQGEAVAVDGKTELACLQRALDSGRGAELTVRHPTTEGDPVTTYYRVTSDGVTEVYTDSTQDAFSDRSWSFASCDQPETVLDANC
jgi:hypothetical protein